MNFILCHEFIHVEREHIDKIIVGTASSLDKIEFEKEADRKAIELILTGVSEERRKSANVGILVGLCSLLYFKNETLGRTHPDTDMRIDTLLNYIKPDNDDPLPMLVRN